MLISLFVVFFVYFFFQAEDGIRDATVTGVQTCALPILLFVCVENSCRSQIAEAFARMHGAGAVEPYSAGSKPSGQVNPKAIASMRELGYDLSRHASKSLSHIPAVEYDLAVTMGCGDACPTVRAKQRDEWKSAAPKPMCRAAFRQ